MLESISRLLQSLLTTNSKKQTATKIERLGLIKPFFCKLNFWMKTYLTKFTFFQTNPF